MTERTWRGTWWPPDEPEATCPGTLYYSQDGRLRLELIGGFDTQVRTPLPEGRGYSVGVESRGFPLIHGVSGSERFTLLGNVATHTSGGMFSDSIQKQDWSSLRGLRGIHLSAVGEPVFTSAHLQLERLLRWSNRSTLNLAIVMQDGKPTGERKVDTQEVAPVSASYAGMKITLRVTGTSFDIRRKSAANRNTLETSEWATLEFEHPDAVAHNAFDVVVKDMQDLLSLCSYAPCAALGRWLVYRPSEQHPGDSEQKFVEVMGRQIYRSEMAEKDEDPYHPGLLLTLNDMELSELVPKWLRLKDTARMGCNILLGLRYIPVGYVGTRLLGVASAAESIHRALRSSSTPLPKAKYRALKRKILASISDEAPAIRDFVNQGLHNNASYAERMLELASIPDADAIDRLLTDRVRWAHMLKNARNDLAHANERSAQAPDSTPALWLLEVSYALLCLVLLSELGVSAERQRAALDHPSINWAAQQFGKVLAGTLVDEDG